MFPPCPSSVCERRTRDGRRQLTIRLGAEEVELPVGMTWHDLFGGVEALVTAMAGKCRLRDRRVVEPVAPNPFAGLS
jgi:hypothetical protein